MLPFQRCRETMVPAGPAAATMRSMMQAAREGDEAASGASFQVHAQR